MISREFNIKLASISWSLALVSLFSYHLASASECPNWQTLHPEWIFCDDFEDSTALVRQGRYFEYDNNGGDFIVVDGAGMANSRGMRGLWQVGEIDAGHLSLGFGRNPNPYMNKGIRSNEDFKEVFYRMYLKMDSGWQGSPAKLSRASIITDASWSQAMIAHLWSDAQSHLLIDPVQCVGTDNRPACIGYNDFSHMTWLGARSGRTTIFDSQHSGQWICVEHHVKLNDPGVSNGVQEFWIDGQLEVNRNDLNFVRSYGSYGINVVFFENYWNTGSPRLQGRVFDNIVVSTRRVGCLDTAPLMPPSNLRVVP